MDRDKNVSSPARARTALVRLGLRLLGVMWEEGDEETAEHFRMRAIPWKKWEAFGAAWLVGIFLAGFAVWSLGRVVDPGRWVFWVLIPVALAAVFAALQMVMLAGVGSAWVARGLFPRWKFGDAGWVAGAVLTGLTLAAVWMCWEGGTAGWIIGLWWILPAVANAVARVVEWCREYR